MIEDLNKLLEEAHEETVKLLLERLKSKEATAAEIAQVVQLLKHNGIQASPQAKGPLESLAEKIPYVDPDATFSH